MKSCKFYVLPSYREGTPRSVLEALSTGRPVITTDAPGCRETVIHEKNGLLVPIKDPQALANAMIRLLNEKDETIKKIMDVLDTKIRPAVARDGGDIKFKSFEKGVVKVELQGSCSGCPSSLMTLKQGVQNLLKHYVKEVNSVEAN